ncbi:MAG TPA: DJ-1/PfpI family protein [Allosphingosinicella sp.]
MIIGMPIYEQVDLLDVAGPYEMFNWVPKEKNLSAVIISEDGCPVTSMNGVRFEAHFSFADAPPLDVLWVPGGAPAALSKLMNCPAYLGYLKQVAAQARWVCSVCEGALLLAQAGLLDGYQATTHWAFVNCLKSFPAIDVLPGNPRFVQSGNRLTGGGISSGLDEALRLIEILTDTGTAIGVQVNTQYFPIPPVQGTIPPAPACPFTW